MALHAEQVFCSIIYQFLLLPFAISLLELWNCGELEQESIEQWKSKKAREQRRGEIAVLIVIEDNPFSGS